MRRIGIGIIFALTLAACTADKEKPDEALMQANTKLQSKVDSLSTVVDSLNQAAPSSAKGFDMLRQEDIEYLKQKGLLNPVETIKNDLAKNSKLIPVEGSLGGTMQFYKERIHVLNRRWVLAYFEDGHNAGEMLLEYKVADNGSISWKVLTTAVL